MKEQIIENKGAKYSVMLYNLVEYFDDQLPKELSFEETLEIGIVAWNLANNEEFRDNEKLLKKELKNYKYKTVIEKMVLYKIEKFNEFKNVIVDYSTDNDLLQVKTQTQETIFNNLLHKIITTKPNKINIKVKKKK
jgi:hypothetical protein